MENGTTTKNNYPCDLDALTVGTRLGLVRTVDKKLEFYKDGVSQGVACVVPPASVYVVIDLYGQCAQVSIPCASPAVPLGTGIPDACMRSDTTVSLQVRDCGRCCGFMLRSIECVLMCHFKLVIC